MGRTHPDKAHYVAQAKLLWREGWSVKDIAAELGMVSAQTTGAWLREAGVKTRRRLKPGPTPDSQNYNDPDSVAPIGQSRKFAELDAAILRAQAGLDRQEHGFQSSLAGAMWEW